MSSPAPRLQAAPGSLDALPLAAWQITADGNGIEFNAAFCHFSGLDHGSLKDMGWLNTLHPDDRARGLALLREAARTARSVDLRVRHEAGEHRWLRITATADEHRRLTFFGTDVTDLVTAQEQASQELALQRQIFDHIPAFILVKDADNNVLRCNRRANSYFQGSDAPMEGHNTYALFPDAVAQAWHQQDRQVIESGQPLLGLVEELNVHGRSRWHRMDKVPFTRTSDGQTLSLVLGVEISDTVELESRLREQIEDSEALVRVLRQREYEQNLILDNIPVVILYKDTDNRVLRANRYAAELLGTTQAELEGRHTSMTLPDEAAALYLHDLDVLRSRQPLTNVIEPITTRRGERRWLRLHHLPCFDATGALTRIMVVGEDITQTRQYEAALHERVSQAEQLVAELNRRSYEQQVILDHLPARIVYKDTNNRVIRASRFAAEMLGLRIDQYEGRDLAEIYGERAKKYYADDLEVIRTRRPLVNLFEELQVPSGATYWMRTEKIPLFDNAGNVTGIIVLSHDLTAEKQAENELRRQRTELQLILDHSPAAIMFRNGDGQILRVNRTCAARIGHSESSLIGQNLKDVFGAQADPWIAEGREVMRSGKPLRKTDIQYSSLNDNSYWRTETVPFYDERGIAAGVVVMAHDVTEQKHVQDELRRQREEMAIILDNIPSMIFVKDGQNNLLQVNRAAAERFGLRVDQLTGKSSDDIFPDPEGRFWQEDLNIMRSRKPRFNMRCEFVGGDGQREWWRYHKVPYFDAGGQATGVIVIVEDVTADIQAQQAIEEALVQARRHEHELDTLFNSLPICVIFKDCDNRILRGNHFAAKFFNVDCEALVGRNIGELVLGSELSYRDTDKEVLESGVPKLDTVHELPLVDGRRVQVRSHKMRYQGADGQVLGLLVAFQSLDEMRRLDADA